MYKFPLSVMESQLNLRQWKFMDLYNWQWKNPALLQGEKFPMALYDEFLPLGKSSTLSIYLWCMNIQIISSHSYMGPTD